MILSQLLNVFASDINTTLEASGTQERVRLQFNGDKVSIERITRTDRTFMDVDSVFILPDATFGEAHHYLVGFQNALSFIPTENMLVAIIEAENFISSFEDDELRRYELSDVWIEQVTAAYQAFEERTENGLLAIEYLIHDLERIKAGEIVFTSTEN